MSTDVLAERYGAPAPWQRRAVLAASVLVTLVAAAWVVWALAAHTTPEVTSQLETYSIDGEHAVTAVVVVSLSAEDVEASCLLRAFSEDHNTVGELAFRPDPDAGQRQVQELRTERRATSVELVGCTTADQPRPR